MAGYIDPNDPVVQAFAQLGTTPVSDALDRLGLGGQVFGIRPIDREFTLCGRAHTVRNEPMTAGRLQLPPVVIRERRLPPANLICSSMTCLIRTD